MYLLSFLLIDKITVGDVLIHLLEEWRECLVNDFVVGGGFMDLSKVFDCIPMIL